MNYTIIHHFNGPQAEKVAIQNALRNKVEIKPFGEKPKVVCGVDISYEKGSTKAICCIVAFDYETHEILEKVHYTGEVTEEYEFGFLAFKELPLFLKTWELLKTNPDIVFFDGNGLLHKNRMGLASHASFFIDKPTVGIAKECMFEFETPDEPKGSFSLVMDNGEVVGVALRTREAVKPVYVSVGNRITLEEATAFTLHLTMRPKNKKDDSRIPIVTRYPDMFSRELLRQG